MQRILIVEDEVALRTALRRHLVARGWEVTEAGTMAEALEAIEANGIPETLLCDVALPDGDAFALAHQLEEPLRNSTLVVMTGNDGADLPVRALRCGAADFLLKPFSLEALDEALERAATRHALLQRPAERPSVPSTPKDWHAAYAPMMVGEDPKLLRIFSMLERVADTDCSVLVTGESGTGKELVARALHLASERRNRAFVAVNCAAIPENLVESELFGHARGAFTGAINARVGRFVQANGGTLLLDEIGELSLAMQAKLLRVLQEKEVTPVGESRTQRIDVRVVAATNRDLEKMVVEGRFREDLLYRLDVIPIELPAIRERRGDIPKLVMHFIERMNVRRGRHVEGISPRALEMLCSFNWPGNVRQIENTIERMVVLRGDGQLDVEDVPERIRSAVPAAELDPMAEPMLPNDGIDLRDAVERFENALIRQALERSGWNKNRAAAILQMNRTTLVEKLKKRDFGNNQSELPAVPESNVA
jgi:DNA-binding NtrC family response regulator